MSAIDHYVDYQCYLLQNYYLFPRRNTISSNYYILL